MANTNIIVIAGNLTADPEMRYTPQGTAVCKLRIANSQKWTDTAGNAQKRVTYVDATAWEKQAESAGKSLRKGDPVLIEGELMMDEWEDKTTGQKRTKLEIRANRVQFLAPPHEGQGAEQCQHQQAPAAGAQPPRRTF